MSKRWIWTLILLAVAIVIMIIERGLLGGLLGSFFIVVALALWVMPGAAFDSEQTDPTTVRVSRTVLGVGLGLLAAAAAALLLPPQLFSWLVIFVGVIMIVWLILSRRR